MAKEPLEYNRPVHPSLYSQAGAASSLPEVSPDSRTLSLVRGKLELSYEAILLQLPTYMEKGELENHLEGLRLKEALAPNISMIGGIRSLDGYDGGLLPTRRYTSLKHHLTGEAEFQPDRTMRESESFVPDSKLLGTLGVEYLVVNNGRGDLDPGWVEVGSDGVKTILRNSNAKPRAYVVHSAKVIRDEQRMLEAISTEELDKIVLLEEEISTLLGRSEGEETVRLVLDRPSEVIVEADLQSPGVLVLSDSYYPGWKVYVDGKEEKLLRANYYLRAVQLPAGHHLVRFSFEPANIAVGLLLSLVGLSMVIATPLLANRWARARPN